MFQIGGNFGLFTGMSILSVFEIAFWVVRFIFGKSRRKNETADNVKGNLETNRKKRRFRVPKKSSGRQPRRKFQTEVGIA